MRLFVGCVILESLARLEPMTGLTPFAQRVADMPEDPDARVWHIGWYRLSESELKTRLPILAQAMRPAWYAHFWEGDDLVVVLAGKFFRASASDRSTWQAFIEYGNRVGIDRKWTESIPTQMPAWVEAALD